MNTGKRVADLAKERHISLSKLAEISGVGYSTLKNAKCRGNQLSVDTIECICTALNIPLADFFIEEAPGDSKKGVIEGQLMMSPEFFGRRSSEPQLTQ